ncbi:MAG: hypothetical protein ABSG46_18470 [Candidatus Binataceae bacterium]|jgi:hypothetical protein
MKPAIIPLTILIAISLRSLAAAGDTDRVADCTVAADMASAAARSRDAGESADQAMAIIYQGAPEAPKGEVKATVAEIYSNRKLTPDQASSEVLQSCLEIETE